MPFLTPLDARELDDGSGEWMLLADLVYQGEKDRFVVPKGFRTDFTSTPWFLRWFIPRTGKYTKAAVVHDFFYRVRPVVEIGGILEKISQRDADGIMKRIAKELGTIWIRRKAIYRGLRMFGWLTWNKLRRQEMTTYYYECVSSHGEFLATSDDEAKRHVANWSTLECLYKESDTRDGLPFIILKETEQ